MNTPHAEYTARLAQRRSVVSEFERLHIRLGNLRLLTAIAAVVVCWQIFAAHRLALGWLLLPLAVFIALAVYHDRVLRARRAAGRGVRVYEQGLARLEDRWAGKGQSGERFLDEHHPYAQDMDLFGSGSLFELLSIARTRAGESTLARWLLQPASIVEIAARQAAVSELRAGVDFREELAVLGEEANAGVHPEPLAAWGEAPPVLDAGATRLAARILTTLAIAAAAVWAVNGFRLPFFIVLLIELAFAFRIRRQIERVVHDFEQPAHDLSLLAEVLERIEREQFTAPRLIEMRRMLDSHGEPASKAIHKLAHLSELVESRDNVAVRMIDPAFLYTVHVAYAVEQWRARVGPHLRQWLEAVGEIEALSSLAGYSYEHPADPFPELSSGAACFEAEEMGHPLLPDSRIVRNSVRLSADARVLVVSGSNMSGKSTLLRTIGVNAALALAGAPVRARRLLLTPVALGASVRVTDSLQSGTSRFYAEITRLRQIVDLTLGSLPVLFLLDELLHGTNSHDRRIGGQAVVRSLVERGAIGLLTTHDLALADIAAGLNPPGVNVHFEDHIENGRILFDYRMRPGVVEKSNALELMRSVGLDV